MQKPVSILFVCLFMPLGNGYAQTLTNTRDASFWISAGALVSVRGDVLNQGTISNQGNLYLSGDWTNEGMYEEASGSLIFSGTRAQYIDHRGQKIASLWVQGSGEKRLNSGAVVLQELTLSEGILTTTPEAPLVLEEAATIQGGSPAAYVNGPLVSQGNGYRYFPVGTSGSFCPLELLDVQGTAPILQVTVKQPNAGAQPDASLESVSQVRYWEVLTLEGSYVGSKVALAVNSDEGFSDLAGVVVAEASQLDAVFTRLGQSEVDGDANSGTIVSAKIATQAYLALAVTTAFSVKNLVLVPSAFAPEAPDMQNRTLRIFAANLTGEGFVFRIFDRWDNLVYETTSVEEARQQGWDGISRETHQLADFGVYTYYLKGQLDNRQRIEKTGSITLFR